MPPTRIFRAYDIRGVYGTDIDPPLFYRIGCHLGAGRRRILVGWDVRLSSPALANALISGILSSGADVIEAGMAPYGPVIHAGIEKMADLITYITASHLPPEWNGIKFADSKGVGLGGDFILHIRDHLDRISTATWDRLGTLSNVDPLPSYLERLGREFSLKGMRAAIDCGGGSTGLIMPELVSRTGLDAVPIFWDVDPQFRFRPSEPDEDGLGVLRETVLSEGCDFGVAFDGDGDRGVIVDPKGRFLGADIVGSIIASHLLTTIGMKGRRVVLVNVESSRVVEDVLIPLGAEVRRIRVGHTHLTCEATDSRVLLGIESSGHMVFPHVFTFDDAVLIPLVLAQVLQETDPLDVLVDALPVYYNRTVNFDCPDEIKFKVISRLQFTFRKEFDHVNTLDGVRVELPEGWCLIRASNTSPVIRLTCESRDEETLDALITGFSKRLMEVMNINGQDCPDGGCESTTENC